jgi:uncharacterized membrane protein (DUF485 family)
MSHNDDLEQLAARRWRVALTLTAGVLVSYFGFILLIAYDKPLMGTLVWGKSISVGVLLGAFVIVLAASLTGVYVRWTNQHYDHAVAAIGTQRDLAAAPGTSPSVPVAGMARARTPQPLAPAADVPNAPASSRPEVRS